MLFYLLEGLPYFFLGMAVSIVFTCVKEKQRPSSILDWAVLIFAGVVLLYWLLIKPILSIL